MISRDSVRGASRSRLGQLQLRQDRRRRRAHLALIERVQLEQAVGALDDLHPRGDPRALQRDVGQRVDGDAGRDLDDQRSLPVERQEPLRDGLQEAGELRLQDVDEREGAQLHRGARRIAPPRRN